MGRADARVRLRGRRRHLRALLAVGNAQGHEAKHIAARQKPNRRIACLLFIIERRAARPALKSVARHFDVREHQVSGRLSELKELGLIHETGEVVDDCAVLGPSHYALSLYAGDEEDGPDYVDRIADACSSEKLRQLRSAPPPEAGRPHGPAAFPTLFHPGPNTLDIGEPTASPGSG